jgi:hypothetical protein
MARKPKTTDLETELCEAVMTRHQERTARLEEILEEIDEAREAGDEDLEFDLELELCEAAE